MLRLQHPVVNVTEYLEYLFALGLREQDLPTVQPICQKRIWDRFKPGEGADRLAKVIEQLKKEDHRFHMEGTRPRISGRCRSRRGSGAGGGARVCLAVGNGRSGP